VEASVGPCSVINYRIGDPQFPTDIGAQLLPFNASGLKFEFWHDAGRALAQSEFKLVFEMKYGPAGQSWRAFPIRGETSSEVGKIEFLCEGWPPQMVARDEDGYFSYRVSVVLMVDGVSSEQTIGFGRAGLVAAVKSIHFYDIDRPSPPGTESALPGEIRRLGVDYVLGSPLEELEVKVLLTRYRERTALWERGFHARTNTPLSLAIDPLPPEVVPASSPTAWNAYELKFECRAEGAVAVTSRRFQVGPLIPPGLLKIDHVGLADHPLFDLDADRVAYSDLWDRAIATVKVTASGYDPAADPRPATASIYFTDRGPEGSHWYASAPIRFEADGSGWAFIDNPFLPPLDLDGAKQIRILVNHNNRTDQRIIDSPAWNTGFRPDRIVEVRSACVVGEDGAETTTIERTSRLFRGRFRIHRSPGGPPVMIALTLRGQHKSHSYRTASSVTKTVAFQLVPTDGTGYEERTLDFVFRALDDSLFQHNSVAASVVVAYRADGIRYAYLHAAADFDIGSFPLDSAIAAPAFLFGRRPPKPTIPPERLSGVHWCAKFPTSTSTATLEQPFRGNVQAFITMLEQNGANVRINATRRPPERAYLMQWAFKIARLDVALSRVPKYEGVDIVWDHERARDAAEEMVVEYDIAYQPAGPRSKHCTGHAIDMTITDLPRTLVFTVAGPQRREEIGAAAASENRRLWALASRYFDVTKLPSDAPHWYAL
jgi:hypothetical protein